MTGPKSARDRVRAALWQEDGQLRTVTEVPPRVGGDRRARQGLADANHKLRREEACGQREAQGNVHGTGND